MTVDEMRDAMHATFAEIRDLQALARARGGNYTGPTVELSAQVGVFGRVIVPARTVRRSGPTVMEMIAFRWDAIRWLQHEIREQRGIPHPTATN